MAHCVSECAFGSRAFLEIEVGSGDFTLLLIFRVRATVKGRVSFGSVTTVIWCGTIGPILGGGHVGQRFGERYLQKQTRVRVRAEVITGPMFRPRRQLRVY